MSCSAQRICLAILNLLPFKNIFGNAVHSQGLDASRQSDWSVVLNSNPEISLSMTSHAGASKWPVNSKPKGKKKAILIIQIGLLPSLVKFS